MHLVRLEILRKVASIIFLSGEKLWRIEKMLLFLKDNHHGENISIFFFASEENN